MTTEARHPDTVLFDLDGTLLDTAPDLIAAANTLLREYGRAPLPEGFYAPVVSHGSAAMVARSFHVAPDDPAMPALRDRFLTLYANRVSRYTRPFPGIAPLLEELERCGVRWGVVTNKPGWLTEPLLAQTGLATRAGCIVSGDTLAWRKPDPRPILHACTCLDIEPGRALVLGDAQRDIDAGRRAGTTTLAAMFGYICAEDHPADWGAHGLAEHPADILRWLRPDAPGRTRVA